MSLTESSVVSDINGILKAIDRVENVLNYYNKAKTIGDLVSGVRQLMGMAEGSISIGDMLGAQPRSLPPRRDFSEIAEEFAEAGTAAFGIGLGNWTKKYLEYARRGVKFEGYVLYMPVLIPTPALLVNSFKKINGKPVKIGFGGPMVKGRLRSGSFGGYGIMMGGERQLFRLDMGPPHPRDKYQTELVDPPAIGQDSYHVYNFTGGPRNAGGIP